MVEAFATYQDLELRLNRTFTVAEQPWITSLLEDASTYLRDDVLGLQVYPQATSTFVGYPEGARVDLPQSPVVSLGAVVQNGVTLAANVGYVRRDNTLYFHSDEPVTVTFTYGYLTAPESLRRWACVLVSQALLPLEQQLGLTAGGLSSVAVDDFKAAWADAGAESGITLSDRNIALLREQFGSRLAWVAGSR
ncbi:MAG: hypothetical protein ACYC6C_08040 [Coriobacteriia bacterium]